MLLLNLWENGRILTLNFNIREPSELRLFLNSHEYALFENRPKCRIWILDF